MIENPGDVVQENIVINGSEVLDWIASTEQISNNQKILELAQSFCDSGMLVSSKSSTTCKFSRDDKYILSYPLFNASSASKRITGVGTNFPRSTDFIFYGKDKEKNNIIIKRKLKCGDGGRRLLQETQVLSGIAGIGLEPAGISQTQNHVIVTQRLPAKGANLYSMATLSENSLSENTILGIVFQIAACLELFHRQGFAYGLLSLKSIYVHGKGINERSTVTLLDTHNIVEIGKEVPPEIRTPTVFTPPEYLNGAAKAHLTSDMWSLGICLYWLLFGFPPYVSSDLSNIQKITHVSPVFDCPGKKYVELSPVTRMILLQLLNHDPERRLSAADLSLWPRKDISNLNQHVTYPFNNSWKSFQYLNMCASETIVSDDISTSKNKLARLWSRSKRSAANPTCNNLPPQPTVEVGLASPDTNITKSFIQKLNLPLNIDQCNLYDACFSDGITTRLHTIETERISLHGWQSSFSAISHLYYIIDITTIDLSKQLSAASFEEHVKAFTDFYLCDLFYDKIRAPVFNIPITVIVTNTEFIQAKWMKTPGSIQLPGIKSDSFETVLTAVENVFVSIKNRTPVPRILKSVSFPSSDSQAILSFIQSNSATHLTRTEAKDADAIISRVIKLKLKRVNVSFPFNNTRGKVTQLPKLSVALQNDLNIRNINMSHLGVKEKEFEEFFTALESNSSLTRLNISFNHIGDAGIAFLQKSICNHKTLHSLILTGTKFTAAGAISIAKLINTLPNIQLLDISRNAIGDEGMIEIVEALFQNRTLTSLHAEECSFLEGGFLALCKLLELHPLETLDISGNLIPNYLLDNLSASLNNSFITVPRKIQFPKYVNTHGIKSKLQANNEMIENHKANAFIEGNDLENYIKKLPQSSPKMLQFSYCNISNWIPIPLSIQRVDLSHNHFKEFPVALLELHSLQELSLAYNELTSIGKMIELKSLVKVSLCCNQISDLTGIGKLIHLTFIDLRWNCIRSYFSIADLENLSELYLDGNLLLKVDFSVQSLPKIKHFSIYQNLIDYSKALIFDAWSHDLRVLNMSHLQIQHIPKEIYLLRNLVDLNLSNNQISTLPPQIGTLHSLRILDLSNNQLREDSLLALYHLELITISLCGNEQLPNSFLSTNVSHHTIKEYLSKQIEERKQNIEIHRAKLMLVGKTGVGKTTVSSMLRTPVKQRRRTGVSLESEPFVPTDGILIHDWVIDAKGPPVATLSVWDMAGADVYKTTHAFFLEERSIFLLCFKLSVNEGKQDVNYWLQMITASAPGCPILLVGTHAELMVEEDITAIGNAMIQKYSPNYPAITNFISICSFDPLYIQSLHESILTQLKNQKYIEKKVPAGYIDLISLIESERNLCNPPFASTREFEYMVMNCGIDSSTQTVAEYLNSLGVISYFNDKKLGVSSSIVLDPSWLIQLISTIITSRDNGIQDGLLYHNHLPKLWSSYPTSLYPFLVNLFNKIEIIYTSKDPHPEHGIYSLVPSIFSTQRLGAQSKFIPIDDFLALGLGTQLERIYQFDFLPFGFFSRLVVRLLHFTTPTFYWRTGLVCASGENTGLVEFEMGRELSVKVRGRNPAKLLRVIVENIDLLLTGWYRNNATVIVPFIITGKSNYQSVGLDHKFSLEELEEAAAFGKSEVEFKSGSTSIPIRIDSIAPDLVMADISEMVMKWDDLTIEKQVGQGAFGKVYSAIYKGNRVAVKQIEVEANMKTEAYREFRREVALCAELQQPAIVALCGVCLDPWALALEFMPHGDLYSFLQNPKNKITWKMRITMAQNIAEAIRFLHSFQPKIIHRDLKSPNCLMASIDPDAEYLVKVTDFGESRAVATSYTGRDRLHNPVWLAPEIMKKEQYTEKADVFSFGIILWELVGRTKPFDEFEIAKSDFTYQLEDAIIEGLRPTIPNGKICPPAYVQMMESCWNGDPKARPQFDEICKQIYRLKESIMYTEIYNSE